MDVAVLLPLKAELQYLEFYIATSQTERIIVHKSLEKRNKI